MNNVVSIKKGSYKMTKRLQRGLEIERRVRDCIIAMGQGNEANGRSRFIDHAIWCASKTEMRLWNDTSKPIPELALSSLKLLLGERGSTARHRATNENWILDIWELACDDYFRVKTAERVEVDLTPEGAPDVATKPTTASLSTRILEAYLANDDGLMIRCLGELEAKGF